MAEFVLNRNYIIRSLSGHTVQFVKGIPTVVPTPCIAEALAIGAERIDAPQDEGVEGDNGAPQITADPSGDERKQIVFKCFDNLVVQNRREDFTAQGVPHVKAIKAAVNFAVENKERDTLWAEYQIAKVAKAAE